VYFANMFCYGWDHQCVGITGITGCMGVVYKGIRALYAVHIPDNTQWNAIGGQDFASYVARIEPKPGKGELFAFLNGNNRTGAPDEVKAIRAILEKPKTTIYRIVTNLGPNSGKENAASVAIVVKHVHGGLEMLYKPDGNCVWANTGRHEVAQYRANDGFKGNKVPSDLDPLWAPAGWYPVNKTNCTVKKL
jgi:hypothetical protein